MNNMQDHAMVKKPKYPANAADLRRSAEAQLRKQQAKQRPGGGVQESEVDARRLFHELQVHHIELEMQNTELQEARDRMETLLEKYTDLYDFAPVGYFSLDEESQILEVNLTGAAMLGLERSLLFRRRLERFVDPVSQPIFRAFLKKTFAGTGKQVCEVALLNDVGDPIWAGLQAVSAVSISDPRKWCRVAVADITSRKRAAETQLRVEALAIANQDLNEEIHRRQVVEDELKRSEDHQRKLLDQARRMQEQMRLLTRRVLLVQEEERKKISRELHDDIAQTLVGINIHLEALSREAAVNPKGLKKKIARTQKLVEKSVNIVHRFARELRPTLLDDVGLIATLHSFMKEFTKQTNIRVHFTTYADVEQLNGAKITVIYRVVQSALNNVARHSEASRVMVSISKVSDVARMEIKDDGKSFNVARFLHRAKNKHLGLIGMRERVEMVGGKFSVESAPGQGTTIRAEIPLVDAKLRRKASMKITAKAVRE
jgi:PAS domain S-box-containing protein